MSTATIQIPADAYTRHGYATCGQEDGHPVHAAACQDTNVEAASALRATSGEALLRTYASLTHQLHSARSNLTSPDRLARYQGLRAQRNLVQAEALRRMGGQA